MDENDDSCLLDKVVPSSSGDEMEQNTYNQPITKEPSEKKVRREQNTNTQQITEKKHVKENQAGHKKKVKRIQNTNKKSVTEGPTNQNINTEPVTKEPSDRYPINTEHVTVTEGPRDQNVNTEQGRGNGNGKHGRENYVGHIKKVRRIGGPHMDHVELFNCYPNIYANVSRCGSYRCTPKKAVMDALLFVSRKSLDKLEEGWMSYYTQGLEVNERRMTLKRKMMKLLYEAQLAYKQQS